MGQKTHPIGFRLGISLPWKARWFAGRGSAYRSFAIEDQKIRRAIKARYQDSGGISSVEIERGPQDLVVTIHTARPGIVIGRGGQRVDDLRGDLEKLTGKRARLNIQEIRQPELDAYLVGRNIAEQLERRIAFRRAMRQSVARTMQAGAQGVKVICAGRLGGAEIARSEKVMEGRVPLHTLRANIEFAIVEAATTFGRIGVKVWIYKGDILPTHVVETARVAVGAAMRQRPGAAETEAGAPPRTRQPRASRVITRSQPAPPESPDGTTQPEAAPTPETQAPESEAVAPARVPERRAPEAPMPESEAEAPVRARRKRAPKATAQAEATPAPEAPASESEAEAPVRARRKRAPKAAAQAEATPAPEAPASETEAKAPTRSRRRTTSKSAEQTEASREADDTETAARTPPRARRKRANAQAEAAPESPEPAPGTSSEEAE